ncbi:DUF7542 family protein [Halalkalicoccus subterraneus]|uniref:DUF7542 family protein n=1 Tax=Halalkalicoccus subterraneus TaxID=2675002 RepID=UPI000EFCF2EC|nr:hypothetical protein [Halalkalicoccus subterraneus]
MNRSDGVRLIVACPDCAVKKSIDDVNEAVAFYRRHHAITGHDVEWRHAELDEGAISGADLRSVIAALETRVEGNVPLGLVTVVMSERDMTIGETLEAVRELRMNGELYEPRDDHLRVT